MSPASPPDAKVAALVGSARMVAPLTTTMAIPRKITGKSEYFRVLPTGDQSHAEYGQARPEHQHSKRAHIGCPRPEGDTGVGSSPADSARAALARPNWTVTAAAPIRAAKDPAPSDAGCHQEQSTTQAAGPSAAGQPTAVRRCGRSSPVLKRSDPQRMRQMHTPTRLSDHIRSPIPPPRRLQHHLRRRFS